MQRRTLLKSALALSATLAAALAAPGFEALAQGGSGKPVRLILPISAGSGGPMVNDLLAGQVEMGVVALNAVAPHLKAGTLRAIGLCGDKRTAAAPDIATIAEQGLPHYNVAGWFAVIGPAGMPAPEVKRVHDAFARAFTSSEVLEAMKKQGTVIDPGTPEAAAAFFRSEAARYAALVKKANVKVE